MTMMKTFLVAALLSTAEGFVPPQSSFTTRASTKTTSLNSEDGIVVFKKGLKWFLVPTSKPPPKPAGYSSSSSESSTVVPETPVTIVEAPFVEPEIVVAPVVSTPPPVVVDAPPAPVFEAAVSTPPPPVFEATPMVEFLPKTAENTAALGGKETMNFEQMLQAFRENHWAHMPRVQESPTLPTGKAPLLMDILKERGEEYEGYVMANGQQAMGAFAERFADRMQASGQIVQQKISVLMDPELYSALKQKLVETGDHGISLEELGKYFKFDDAVLALPTMSQLQQNLNMEQVQVATASWGDFTSSIAAVKALLQQDGGVRSYNDIVTAMNLKETGGWYFGAASLAFLLVLSVANTSGKSSSRTIIMTDAALPDAAVVPVMVASSAVMESNAVEDQVVKLKAATADVYEQLREMKAEKYARAYEVATMQSELRNVMNRLDANLQEEQQLKLSLAKTQDKLQTETQYLRRQLDERVAAEDELRQQLTDTKEKLAQEMAKVKTAKQQAEQEVAVAEAQVKKLLDDKSKMEQEMMALRSEMDKLHRQIQTSPKGDKEDVPVLQPPSRRVNGDDSPQKTAVNGAATQTLTKPSQTMPTKKRLPSTSYSDLSDAFFLAVTEPAESSKVQGAAVRGVKGVAMPNGEASKKRILSKRVVAKKLVRAPDWSGMSSDALSRKTVKELATYLEAKGASTTSPDGKLLKKETLVERVESVLSK